MSLGIFEAIWIWYGKGSPTELPPTILIFLNADFEFPRRAGGKSKKEKSFLPSFFSTIVLIKLFYIISVKNILPHLNSPVFSMDCSISSEMLSNDFSKDVYIKDITT